MTEATIFRRQQLVPYLLEIRDTANAALVYLDEIAKIAHDWDAAEAKNRHAGETDHEASSVQVRCQGALFNALESFLAAFARLSLLLFPETRSQFAKERGRALVELLELPRTSPLADRELRNAWMHHDERLDQRIAAGQGAEGQRFMRSSEITPRDREYVLRLVAVDTLTIYYHDQAGKSREASLFTMRAGIEELQRLRKERWRARLPGME